MARHFVLPLALIAALFAALLMASNSPHCPGEMPKWLCPVCGQPLFPPHECPPKPPAENEP